jgi:hypothetical protein
MQHRVGRVQKQIRRSLIAAAGSPVHFSDLMDRAYARSNRRWRWPIYRALKRYGVNVGRGLWGPGPELAARLRRDMDVT